jgi:hypothetical protein
MAARRFPPPWSGRVSSTQFDLDQTAGFLRCVSLCTAGPEVFKNADFTRGPNPRCCCGCGFLDRINEAWIENGLAVFTFAIHAKGNGNSR